MWATETEMFTCLSELHSRVCQPFLSLKGLEKHDLIPDWFNSEVGKDSIWTAENHSVWAVY